MTNTATKNWRDVELGDVIDFFDSKRVPLNSTQRQNRQGVYPYYGASGVIDHIDDFIFDGDYLLIAEDGENLNSRKLPIAFWARGKFWVNNHAHIVRGKKNVADTEFLKNWFANANISGYVTGSAQPKLSQQNLKRIKLSLPEFTEQEQIADILSRYNYLIENISSRIKILEEMAQAIYTEWFVSFHFPDHEKVKMTDSGTEFGKIPERWAIKMLPEVLDFLEGPGIRNWQYTPTGCPFINIRLIRNGDIDINSANFISEEEANGKYKHFHLQERDMIVSTSGTLGRSAIVREEHLPLMLNTSVIRFKPIDGQNYAFMYQFLNATYFQNKILSMASGSAQPNFGPMHLKQIQMLIPSQKILDTFENLAGPLYAEMLVLLSQNQNLRQTRDLLLPKLVSGEMKI